VLTTRPLRRASFPISAISSSASAKSKIAMFSDSRSIFEVRGITIAPFCTSQRSDTCPAVLPCRLPIRASVSSPAACPCAIGE